MWQRIKDAFWYVHSTFHGSEVILWQRLQILGAAVLAVLLATDMSPFIKPEYLPIWVVVSSVMTEYLRRRRAEQDDEGRFK